jgi:ABC-type xylose transport system permease subunit
MTEPTIIALTLKFVAISLLLLLALWFLSAREEGKIERARANILITICVLAFIYTFFSLAFEFARFIYNIHNLIK